ncbi:transcriptional regulator FeaR [Yokenella regensburgei]|uniref:transcriptional regulator FeaR n=1 Tax=Yokenella regensburgei TaxID=158877 RepID=UPI003EDAD63B
MRENSTQNYRDWLAKVNQLCGSFDARPLEGQFYGDIESGYARGMKVSTVTTQSINLFRTMDDVRRSSDAWFYTVFQLEGQAVMEQDDRQIVLEAGDMTLIDAARPCSFYWQGTSRQVSLLLPRQLIEQQQRRCSAGKLSRHLPMVQLSHRLLQESLSSGAMNEDESAAALEAIGCLLRPVLHQQDVQPSRRERQYQKIMALIDDSIQSEQLRPEWLASETGMSVRSLYRMFADKGLVVAQYIKNRRLDLCAQALERASDEEKLAGIGYSWGFTDHSHFSTAFKQRFGVTPGEYRRRFR